MLITDKKKEELDKPARVIMLLPNGKVVSCPMTYQLNDMKDQKC